MKIRFSPSALQQECIDQLIILTKWASCKNTTITKSTLRNDNLFLSLVDFQSVLHGSLKPCFLTGTFANYYLRYWFEKKNIFDHSVFLQTWWARLLIWRAKNNSLFMQTKDETWVYSWRHQVSTCFQFNFLSVDTNNDVSCYSYRTLKLIP